MVKVNADAVLSAIYYNVHERGVSAESSYISPVGKDQPGSLCNKKNYIVNTVKALNKDKNCDAHFGTYIFS